MSDEQRGEPAARVTGQKEVYTHGYSESVTAYMASRSAQSQAGFFTPHLSSGMRLLDCGCGPGAITIGLAQAVAPGEAVGIDIEPDQVDIARLNAEKQGVPNVAFEVASCYEIPFPDSSFDAVFAHAVLEHLKEPAKAVDEMYRVLRPGGVIGVRDADEGMRVLEPYSPVLELLIELRRRVWRHNGGDPYMGRRLHAMLRQTGFGQIKASASSEHPGVFRTAEDVGEFWAAYFSTPGFIEQVVRNGWADRPALESMANEWIRWSRDANAVCFQVYCEAVGFKNNDKEGENGSLHG